MIGSLFGPIKWFQFGSQNRKIVLLILIGLLHPSASSFGLDKGSTTADFLKMPTSAKAVGLGQAFTAYYGDAGSLDYNPAGLVGLYRTELGLNHQILFEETALSAASIAFPTTLPSNFSSLNNGAPFIPRDKIFWGFNYKLLSANDDERSSIGANLGEFDIKDQAFQGGMAVALLDQWTVGASAKLIKRTLKNESISGTAFDLGLMFMLNEKLTLAASSMNMGSDQTFLAESDPLPTTLRSGIQWRARQKLKLLADVSQGRDSVTRVAIGSEFQAAPILQLRAGTTYHDEIEFSAGLGLLLTHHGTKSSAKKPDSPFDTLTSDTAPAPPSTQPKPISLGLDYAARFNQALGPTHSMTVKLLF